MNERKKKAMKNAKLFAIGLVALVMALVPSTVSAAVAPPSVANNSLLINVSIPIPGDPTGVFAVQFRCAPGTVTGANPGVITLTDPATPFDTTTISASAPVGETTVPNACSNSVNANFSQIDVTTTGSDGVDSVAPGGATILGDLSQSAGIPGSLFVTGYRLGLLQLGVNNISANVQTKIEATNTIQGVQASNTVGGTPPNGSVLVTTTITDPTPADVTSGDEAATPGTFSVSYDDLAWTAGASGSILYRQDSIVPAVVDAPPPDYGEPPKPKKKCKKGFKLKKIKKKGKKPKKKCVRVKKKKKKK